MNLAYYNDNDLFCAKWLNNLVDAGLLREGYVDGRSVVEVRSPEIAGYNRCHFFAGIGGWELALNRAGWGTAPVWTASLPCQPFSVIGDQRGIFDERHLWPVFRRLVEQCRPPTIFGEQVASKAGRQWLAGVFSDLENLGYAVAGADLCAAGVQSPHIRQRLYWVAHATCTEAGTRQCGVDSNVWNSCTEIRGYNGEYLRIQSGLEPMVDGVPFRLADGRSRKDVSRKDVSQAIGNSIVVPLAAEFIKAYMDVHDCTSNTDSKD